MLVIWNTIYGIELKLEHKSLIISVMFKSLLRYNKIPHLSLFWNTVFQYLKTMWSKMNESKRIFNPRNNFPKFVCHFVQIIKLTLTF